MAHDIHHLPLSAVDEGALPRDRAALDQTAPAELDLSIAAHSLRRPIEMIRARDDNGPPSSTHSRHKGSIKRATGHTTTSARSGPRSRIDSSSARCTRYRD